MNGGSPEGAADQGVDAAAIQPSKALPTWLKRHGQKLTAAAFWLALLGAYAGYAASSDLSPLATLERLVAFLSGEGAYGPLLFVALYALRPLIFFSAALLSIAAGFLFGPVLGVICTVIGANLGAALAYLMGRYFGGEVIDASERSQAGTLRRYAGRMRRHGFTTVLAMRFLYVPYDLVNYGAGLLRVNFLAFFVATVLGTLPGTVSFVLFGASSGGDLSTPTFDLRVLAASLTIFVVSLLLARMLRRREPQGEPANADPVGSPPAADGEPG